MARITRRSGRAPPLTLLRSSVHETSSRITRAESYRLGKRLRAGRSGEVYEATHPRLPGRYGIKIFPPEMAADAQALRLFRAELEAIAAAHHPNIVQIVEVGTQPDGAPFIVMELLEGRTLADRLSDGRSLALADAVAVVKAIAGGLQAAHGRGVVHRALAPKSVFLATAAGHDPGFVKLLGFGVARLRAAAGLGGLDDEPVPTTAPEQARGRLEEIDGRTDQFALGVIAYQLIGGVAPFRGEDPIRVLYQVVHEQPAPLDRIARVPSAVDEVVQRALAKDREQRFDTVLGFARALEAAVGGVRVSTPVAPRPAVVDDELPPDLFEEEEDDDGTLDRVPRARWRAPALVLIAAAAGVALWAGWRPATWWHGGWWRSLRLPGFVAVSSPTPQPPPAPPPVAAQPAPIPPPPAPPVAEAPPAAAESKPPAASAPRAPERPSPRAARHQHRPRPAHDLVWSERLQRLVPAGGGEPDGPAK